MTRDVNELNVNLGVFYSKHNFYYGRNSAEYTIVLVYGGLLIACSTHRDLLGGSSPFLKGVFDLFKRAFYWKSCLRFFSSLFGDFLSISEFQCFPPRHLTDNEVLQAGWSKTFVTLLIFKQKLSSWRCPPNNKGKLADDHFTALLNNSAPRRRKLPKYEKISYDNQGKSLPL